MSMATAAGATIRSERDPAPEAIYRISVEQYEAMVASGLFTKRDRLHLINGILVRKMTQHPPHVVACESSRMTLEVVLPRGWHIRIDRPLRIPKLLSEPEPDLVVARGAVRDYLRRHPGPSDVAMVIEVSDSSLAEDRKMALIYAGGKVRVYWIVNLVDEVVEVYTRPGPDGYRSRHDYRRGEEVPVRIGGVAVGRVAVDDLLP